MEYKKKPLSLTEQVGKLAVRGLIIDDEELAESEWGKIFEVQEDGSFYMSDYVGAEAGCLTEIRFDKVKYR